MQAVKARSLVNLQVDMVAVHSILQVSHPSKEEVSLEEVLNVRQLNNPSKVEVFPKGALSTHEASNPSMVVVFLKEVFSVRQLSHPSREEVFPKVGSSAHQVSNPNRVEVITKEGVEDMVPSHKEVVEDMQDEVVVDPNKVECQLSSPMVAHRVGGLSLVVFLSSNPEVALWVGLRGLLMGPTCIKLLVHLRIKVGYQLSLLGPPSLHHM